MSDDNLSQPDEGVSHGGGDTLQDQLKAVKTERDRLNFEKAEALARAKGYEKERDDLKAELASVLSERDRVIGDVVTDHEKTIADLVSERDRLAQEKAAATALVQNMTRLADDAKRRADEAGEEITRLKGIVADLSATDPCVLLVNIAAEKTKTAVAWVRGKIPADSPILPWFDKTVEVVTRIGCIAVGLTRDFLRWATPRAIELFNHAKKEVEAFLAKK